MPQNTSTSTDAATAQRELHDFVVAELASGPGSERIDADEDLIQRGIVDSLGVQQLLEFCQTRYGIQVEDVDLVPENFKTLRQLAAFVERKQAEAPAPSRRLRLRPRRG
jgi:acyl carrier protein